MSASYKKTKRSDEFLHANVQADKQTQSHTNRQAQSHTSAYSHTNNLAHARAYKKQAALAILLAIISSLAAAALMFVGGYLISKTAQSQTTLYQIMIPVALIQLCGFAKPVLNYIQRLISHDFVLRISSFVRTHIFELLSHMKIFDTRKFSSGDFVKLLVKDVEHLQNLYLRCVLPYICSIIVFIILCVIFAALSWQLLICIACLLALALIVIPLAAFICSKNVARNIDTYQKELYAQLNDCVFGALDIKLAARTDEALQKISELEKNLHKEKLKVKRFMRVNTLLQTCIFCACVLVICAWSASAFGANPQNDAFNFVSAFVLGFFPLIELFAPVCEQAFQAQMHRQGILHLETLENCQNRKETLEKEFQEQEKRVTNSETVNNEATKQKKRCSNNGEHSSSIDTKYSIELKDVSFSYNNSEQVIFQDFNLQIKTGEKIAILGKSGCGKSTLVDILAAQLVPQKGEVCIANVPIQNLNANIYKLISFIEQDSYVFNRSVRDNLLLSAPSVSDEQIFEALKSAQLLDFVQSLPDGLDCILQEAGTRFSGGQKQRLLLARALLADTPIIVLDEPFNALDPYTQHILTETLFEATKNKTLLVVTHHLQDIKSFDRVIMLKENASKITEIEFDSLPENLLKTNEHFKQVYEFDKNML